MTARRSPKRRRASCSRTCSATISPARAAGRSAARRSIPSRSTCPLLNIVSTTDRIVPAATAAARRRAARPRARPCRHGGRLARAPAHALGAAGRAGFPALQQAARARRRSHSRQDRRPAPMTDVVITAAKRTPVGSLPRRLRRHPGARARPRRDRGGAGAGGRRAGRGVRSHPRPGADRRPGPESGPPGVDGGGHAQGGAGLGRQPGLRLGPARGRARQPGDPDRRRDRSSSPAARRA